jgi:hypothetical protein
MAHNPMVEIVLEHALNALTDVQTLLAEQIVGVEFEIINIEKHMIKGETAEHQRKKLDRLQKLKDSVDKVVRQGNSLDI